MSEEGIFVAQELFADVLEGAQIVQVDPRCCIPFIKVRSVVKSGVQRLKFSYTENHGSGLSTGIVSGGLMPTVVSLKGSLFSRVTEHFRSEHGLDDSQADEHVRSKEDWYGVVDGSHRLQALLELLSEYPEKWEGFKWSVMLLPPGQPLSVLRAFARGQNLKQSDDRFIETTNYDLIAGLQEEVKRLAREFGGRSPTAKELAENYGASRERTSSNLKALANIALRLSERVVSKIGEITNQEDPDQACVFYALRGITTYTPQTVSLLADCRIYRNFLSISSLRLATTFLRQGGPNSDDIRVYTLCRLKECSRLSGYKPISYRMVNEQFNKAAAAIKEAEKFEELLQSTKWPIGMEKLKENLLENTVLDEEVERNSGNDRDILPVIRDQFFRCCPQKAPLLEARYNASRMLGTSSPTGSTVVRRREGRPDEDDLADGTKNGAEDQHRSHQDVPEEDEENKQQSAEGEGVTEDLERLNQLGIRCYEMSWQHYNRTLHTTTDELFDIIITEPPSSVTTRRSTWLRAADETIDEAEMNEFAAFGRRVVVPVGYVLIITNARNFKPWVRSFRANEFSVMDHPFVIVRDGASIQRSNMLLFPQSVCDFVVMAVCLGKHPKGFKPVFDIPYNLVNCTYKRKFAVMDKAQGVRKRLKFPESRVPVRTSEQNSDVLAELLVTFSPEGARVMDPYAGTMTTGAACMKTNRKCILIEKDTNCFSLAFRRLGIWSQLYVSSQSAWATSKTPRLDSNESGSIESGANESVKESSFVVPSDGSESAGVSQVNEYSNNGSSSARLTSYSKLQKAEKRLSPRRMERGSQRETQLSPRHEPLEMNTMRQVRVHLLVNGEIVGNADIQKDHSVHSENGSKHGWKVELHGQSLSDFAKDDEDLVVVWRADIIDECKDYAYPYKYGGLEDPITKLGEMSNGFYAWDLNAMTPVMLESDGED